MSSLSVRVLLRGKGTTFFTNYIGLERVGTILSRDFFELSLEHPCTERKQFEFAGLLYILYIGTYTSNNTTWC